MRPGQRENGGSGWQRQRAAWRRRRRQDRKGSLSGGGTAITSPDRRAPSSVPPSRSSACWKGASEAGSRRAAAWPLLALPDPVRRLFLPMLAASTLGRALGTPSTRAHGARWLWLQPVRETIESVGDDPSSGSPAGEDRVCCRRRTQRRRVACIAAADGGGCSLVRDTPCFLAIPWVAKWGTLPYRALSDGSWVGGWATAGSVHVGTAMIDAGYEVAPSHLQKYLSAAT